jgi:hypothetical protein
MTRREFMRKYPTEGRMAADICHQMIVLENKCDSCPLMHQCISNDINPKYVIATYKSMFCIKKIDENDILDILEK